MRNDFALNQICLSQRQLSHFNVVLKTLRTLNRTNCKFSTTYAHTIRFVLSTKGKDVKTTVELLRLLTQSGADVDLQKNNGQVALHTAARRGPLQAVWVLLFSKATHDVVDHRFFTPEGAAARAGKKEIVALLANWPIARLKYLDSEFIQEWMHFLCDPEANLEKHLTASEVLAQV